MTNLEQGFSRFEIYYREFPELLFTTHSNGTVYFNATSYIQNKGDPRIHSVQGFKKLFSHWISAVCVYYKLPPGSVFITAFNGHELIDNALALLFVSYIDPAFGLYMVERISDMLLQGIVLSDTCLLTMAKERLTKDQL